MDEEPRAKENDRKSQAQMGEEESHESGEPGSNCGQAKPPSSASPASHGMASW